MPKLQSKSKMSHVIYINFNASSSAAETAGPYGEIAQSRSHPEHRQDLSHFSTYGRLALASGCCEAEELLSRSTFFHRQRSFVGDKRLREFPRLS